MQDTYNARCKGPSFSSSLLDAIYHSIDEATEQQEMEDFVLQKRNNAARVQEDIESLRRAIMVENWMENYCTSHFSSNSASSTDSSIFSSSSDQTEPCKSIFSSSQRNAEIPIRERPSQLDRQKCHGRLTGTKSKARKNICGGDLKKAKEPISPGAKIANFLNSIFRPRSLNKNNQVQSLEEWSSMRKPRSVKNPTTCSRYCLSKKPKRSVSMILDQNRQPYNDEHSIVASVPTMGSKFIKKNIESLGLRLYEGKNLREHDLRDYCLKELDVDDMSCTSSDLFELENIGRVGTGTYEEELPVYGTTSLKINQGFAGGLII
ncbi:UNVERIFIED_CONTAM: protein BIG GRAIN 1-like B [Sesamum angustifolium]|uniref:Protein BIG GRAIN 1-like B n=1 Tax=Sesamum angustifolium TaxID=2727405 RepID=A0AAW2MRL5_9LAMI